MRHLLKILYTFIFLVTVKVGHAQTAYTAERPLIIVCDWDKPPYEFRNDAGLPVGFNVDVLTKMLEDMKIPYQFRMNEWSKVVEDFMQGKADIILDNVRRYRNDARFFYTQNIISYDRIRVATAMSDSTKVIPLETLDASDETVFYPGDYTAIYFRKKMMNEDKPIRYESAKMALEGLETGKCRYFVWGEEQLKGKIKELNLGDKIKLHETKLSLGKIHIIGHDKKLINEIDAHYSRLKQSGEVEDIYNKWFHPERVHSRTSPLAIYISVGILIMAAIVYLFSRIAMARIRNIIRNVEEERASRNIRHCFNSLFNMPELAMAFYSRDGRPIAFNTKMKAMYGFDNPDNERFWRTMKMYDIPLIRDAYPQESTHNLQVCQVMNHPELGTKDYIESHVMPVRNAEGEITQFLYTMQDIDEEQQLCSEISKHKRQLEDIQKKSQQQEQRLHRLLSDGSIYIFEADIATRTMTFSHSFRKKEYSVTFEEFLDMTAGDEKTDVVQLFSNNENNLDDSSDDRFIVVHHFKHTLTSDKPQWFSIIGHKRYDTQGNVVGFAGISAIVTDLIEAQQRLQETTDLANDSIRLKSAFLANMTHELRTPLNAVVGFTTILQMTDTPEEREELIKIILDSCDMLQRLINDILEASSITTEAPTDIQPTEVDFVHSFDTICLTLQHRVEQANLQFIVENPYDNFFTTIDVERVQQIITNFVTNAVKFTSQGHIRLGYRHERDGLYIYCEDTGIGIPKDKQTIIFERFVKLDEFIQGTGLGLAICKSITQRLGGEIGVTSEGTGRGATFWIWIPCKKEQA